MSDAPTSPVPDIPGATLQTGLSGDLGNIKSFAQLKNLLDRYYLPANLAVPPGATGSGGRSVVVQTGGGISTPYVISVNGQSGAITLSLGSVQHVYNVLNAPFYAVGNGVADDTAAIQAAIAAAEADTDIGVVLLPPGRYLVSSSLTISSAVVIQGFGGGAGSTEIIPSTGAFNVFAVSGSGYGIVFRDFRVTYSGATGTAHYAIATANTAPIGFSQVIIDGVTVFGGSGGFQILGGNRVLITDCAIDGTNPGDGIQIGNVTELLLSDTSIGPLSGATPVGLHFTSAFAGAAVVSGLREAGAFTGLQFDSGAAGSGVTISGCAFVSNSHANYVDSTLTGTSPPSTTCPKRITRCQGINPFGFLASQPYGGSPPNNTTMTNPYPDDAMVYINANGNVSVIAIGGTNILGGTISLAGTAPVTVKVPWNTSINVQYSAGTFLWGWIIE